MRIVSWTINSFTARWIKKGCNIGTHRKCFGMQTVPVNDWFCELCREFGEKGFESVVCGLCGLFGGIIRQTSISASVGRVSKINPRIYLCPNEEKRFQNGKSCEEEDDSGEGLCESYQSKREPMMLVESTSDPFKLRIRRVPTVCSDYPLDHTTTQKIDISKAILI